MTDFDTALEECEYQGLWFADVANYMLHEKDASFFICHWHLYDYINHIHLDGVDPVCPAYDPNKADDIMHLFRKAYIVGDKILKRMWDAADDTTYVGVLSDHGASPDVRIANIRKFLHDSGFTVLKEDASDGVERDEVLEREIDFEKTRAYLKDDKGFDIWINAEPGPKFDEIERDLLLALRTWVDEDIGRNVIAIALPRRDAYILGQWGDQCGDVIFRLGSRIRQRLLRPVERHCGWRLRRRTRSLRRTPRRLHPHAQRHLIQLWFFFLIGSRHQKRLRAPHRQTRLHPRRRRRPHALPHLRHCASRPEPGCGCLRHSRRA